MNTWGLYSYYLASPFNLLCVLFPARQADALRICHNRAQTGLHPHQQRLVCAKALWTCPNPPHSCFPSRSRFAAGPSATCATRSGSIASSSCPSAHTDATSSSASRRMIRLVIATALNVMFCWYTAYISILFLCIFVLVEFIDYVAEEGFSWKLMLDRALRFAGGIALGLLLSAWTFLPTILAMAKGGPVLTLGPLLKTRPQITHQGLSSLHVGKQRKHTAVLLRHYHDAARGEPAC